MRIYVSELFDLISLLWPYKELIRKTDHQDYEKQCPSQSPLIVFADSAIFFVDMGWGLINFPCKKVEVKEGRELILVKYGTTEQLQ